MALRRANGRLVFIWLTRPACSSGCVTHVCLRPCIRVGHVKWDLHWLIVTPCPIYIIFYAHAFRLMVSPIHRFMLSATMRYAQAMSFLVRRLVTCKMEPCSMSSGILFHISCNTVPCHLEQGSISHGRAFHVIWNKSTKHL